MSPRLRWTHSAIFLLAGVLSPVVQSQTAGVPAPSAWKNSLLSVDQLWKRGKYDEAEAVLLSALRGLEKSRTNDIRVPVTLNGLGSLYQELGRYADAEKFYRRSITASERLQQTDGPAVASSLNNLATLYLETGQYAKAEPLLHRCLDLRLKYLGADSPEVAVTRINLGELCRLQHKYADAEPLLRDALEILDGKTRSEHPYTAEALKNLALLMQETGRYTDAVSYSDRVLAILEKSPNQALLIQVLNNRALLYVAMGRPALAEECLRKALFTAEKSFGPEHPNVGGVLTNYAVVMRRMHRKSEAKQLEKRAKAILDKCNRENFTGYAVDISVLRSSAERKTDKSK